VFQPPNRPDPRGHHRDPRWGPDPRMRFGFREMFGGQRFGRGPIRRGDIRLLILATLAARPMHGYEIIQELEARSGGRWRPSAGSVYPTLQQLADEGLVTSQEVEGGRRTYTLTDEGRAAASVGPVPDPWSQADSGPETDVRKVGLQLLQAVVQVERIGSVRARQETMRILAEARRQVYRLLADDEAEPGDDETPGRA